MGYLVTLLSALASGGTGVSPVGDGLISSLGMMKEFGSAGIPTGGPYGDGDIAATMSG